MCMQVEEYGRDMYKLYKMFNAKAKQLSRSKEKEAPLMGGAKKDKDAQQQDYAPIKLTSQIQDSIKLFKVCVCVCI